MALDLRSPRPRRLSPPGVAIAIPVCDAPPSARLIPYGPSGTGPRRSLLRAGLAAGALTVLALVLAAGFRA